MDTIDRDKLLDDLRVVASDVEELLRATANQTGDRVNEARAREAERYVQDNPWQAVGIAAGVAFLLGYLIGRR